MTVAAVQEAGSNLPGSADGFHAIDVAVGPTGEVYVLSRVGAVVRKVSETGVVAPFAGIRGRRGSLDGPGATAEFGASDGRLTIREDGTLFVTDPSNNTVRRITPSGVVTTIGGQVDQFGSDQFGSVTDGIGGNARFRFPGAIASNRSGHLFFVDSGGSVVRRAREVNVPVPPVLNRPPARSTDSFRGLGARSRFMLDVDASGAAPLAFQWSRNGTPISGATSATLTLPSVTEADNGDYTVTVSNSAGSVTSLPLKVQVYTPNVASFTTRRSEVGGSFLWSIASGAGQLVTVGTGGKILSSTDGRTWLPRVSGTQEWLVGVTYGGGKFVAVGDRGVILDSVDGIEWKRALSTGTEQRLNNVAFGDGHYVAVGEAGVIVTSNDALTWTLRHSGGGWLRALVHKPVYRGPNGNVLNGGFYASGQVGRILTSVDGQSWVSAPGTGPETTPGQDLEAFSTGPAGIGQDGFVINQWHYTYYNKGRSSTNEPIMQSFTGWRTARTSIGARFRGLATGAGAFFATGENGLVVGAPGIEGPWSVIPTGTTANLVHGVFHGNSLYVVGENETILQSEPLYTSRFINIATRGVVGAGENTMISGFVVTGSPPRSKFFSAPPDRRCPTSGFPTPFRPRSSPCSTNSANGWRRTPDGKTALIQSPFLRQPFGLAPFLS